MSTTSSKSSRRFQSLGLFAFAIVAASTLTPQNAAAQCRNGQSHPGYGNTSSYNNNFNTSYGASGNSGRYGYGTSGNNYNNYNNYNNRLQTTYQGAFGAYSGYSGSSNQRPLVSLGLSHNNGLNSQFNPNYNNYRTNFNQGYDNYGSRSGYSTGSYNTGTYGSSQQPVAFRHGDHVDVEVGGTRYHTTGQGY